MYTEVPYVHQAILANLSSSLLQPSQTMTNFDQISYKKQQNNTPSIIYKITLLKTFGLRQSMQAIQFSKQAESTSLW